MMRQPELPKVNLSQNIRRLLVLLQHGILGPIGLLILLVPSREWSLVLLLVFVVAMLISAALHTTVALSIGNICQGKLERLDERERSARDEAFILSFQIITAVVSLAWFYAMIANYWAWWLPQSNQIWIILWLIGMLTYGLPTSVAAWKMRSLED